MGMPDEPKIYHIVPVETLALIIADGFLWCDAEIQRRPVTGPTIGMAHIKQRRRTELKLTSYPDLYVGDCVPFYFCPRSIMLYLINQQNHNDMTYDGGQKHIVHLEADIKEVVDWAENRQKRWAFTLGSAATYFFEDRCNLAQLGEINWGAVQAKFWNSCKDGKQAEFLIENQFPWELVKRIGVHSNQVYIKVMEALQRAENRPPVEIKPDWYY